MISILLYIYICLVLFRFGLFCWFMYIIWSQFCFVSFGLFGFWLFCRLWVCIFCLVVIVFQVLSCVQAIMVSSNVNVFFCEIVDRICYLSYPDARISAPSIYYTKNQNLRSSKWPHFFGAFTFLNQLAFTALWCSNMKIFINNLKRF